MSKSNESASGASQGRVTGIGGIFFRSKDPAKTRQWYTSHLNMPTDEYGTNFIWRQETNPDQRASTQWSAFKERTDYFGDMEQDFMVNYRVENLDALLASLAAQGVKPIGDIQEFDYGRFAHIVDSDNRRVELWEPVDEIYATMLDATVS